MSDVTASRIFTRFDDKRALYMPVEPVFAGGMIGSYMFERQKLDAAGQTQSHVFDEHVFMLPLGADAVRFQSCVNGRKVQGLIEPKRFRFLAAGDSLSTAWDAPLEGIFVTLHPDLLQRALGEELAGPSLQLVSNIMPHEDEVLMHLTLAMQSHLMAGRRAGRLFEQSLLTAMAGHLLSAYSQGKRVSGRSAALPRWKRLRVEEYVRQNCSRDLDLAEIATAVGLHPHHLSRAFRASTGQGLWQFVLECRVREAVRLMNRSRALPLSHVASACGFESYSQFVAAFRKFLGQLPSEYRRSRDN
ncbi:MAG TPA: AraC family transcriptional regulator [Gammaproteobacteria bacterium]